jgi:hypothetical protein
MQRCILLRLTLLVALAAALLPAASFAQSQDSESVADAARRAREQKKPPAKPVKVLTDDDVKPAIPASTDATPATGAPVPAASTAAASDSTAAIGVVTGNSSSPAPDAKDQKDSREVAELKAQIKQAKAELDLALRELSLDQDTFYSNTDYAHDTAGKAKLDEEKQQTTDKQQEVDRLVARLAAMLPSEPAAATPPPKP